MTREESLRRAFMLGHELDFRGNRARTLLSFLKTQNAYNITEAINKVLRYLKRVSHLNCSYIMNKTYM